MEADPILVLEVDDDVFEGEASLLTEAGQHVPEGEAGPRGGQGAAAVRQVHAAVAPLHTTLVWRHRTHAPIIGGRDGGRK